MRRAWLVVGLLFFVAAMNYMARVMITTMHGSIVAAIPMSEAEFGLLTSVFLWTYGVLSPLAGFVSDRLAIVHDHIGQHLDRHLLLELRVVRQPDDAHAAAAEDARQHEAVEYRLARLEAANGCGLEKLVIGDRNKSGIFVFHGGDLAVSAV